MPDWKTDYVALRQRAGIAELERSVVQLTGSDRASLLHGLCTNDIKRLQPGKGCEAFLTNISGKTIGYVYVFCEDESLVLSSAVGQAEAIIAALDRYIIREDVTLTDRTDLDVTFLVAGPQATDRLGTLTDQPLPAKQLDGVNCTLNGIAAAVRRVPYLAGDCYFVTSPGDAKSQLAEAFTSTGLEGCAKEAVEAARIEDGTPMFGLDITDGNLPQEVDRNDAAISFTKGCYLGQETVARLDAMGHVNRTLVGLSFTGDDVPPAGTEINVDGKVVAVTLSACRSPQLQRPLALAYLRCSVNKPGASLATQFGAAEVVDLPLASQA